MDRRYYRRPPTKRHRNYVKYVIFIAIIIVILVVIGFLLNTPKYKPKTYNRIEKISLNLSKSLEKYGLEISYIKDKRIVLHNKRGDCIIIITPASLNSTLENVKNQFSIKILENSTKDKYIYIGEYPKKPLYKLLVYYKSLKVAYVTICNLKEIKTKYLQIADNLTNLYTKYIH